MIFCYSVATRTEVDFAYLIDLVRVPTMTSDSFESSKHMKEGSMSSRLGVESCLRTTGRSSRSLSST
jgi:hypothetical protein